MSISELQLRACGDPDDDMQAKLRTLRRTKWKRRSMWRVFLVSFFTGRNLIIDELPNNHMHHCDNDAAPHAGGAKSKELAQEKAADGFFDAFDDDVLSIAIVHNIRDDVVLRETL
jgi:hypothetical protein